MAYEPNFVDLLTAGTDSEAQQQARAIAAQLRGDKIFGQMGLLGGPRTSAIGKEILTDADQADKGLLTAGVNRLHYGQQMQDMKRQHDQAMMDKALEVQRLKNEGMLGAAQLRALAGNSYRDQKDEATANEKIRLALDPNGPRAGNYGQYAKRATVLGDVKRLLDQFPNPTAQQWYEIAKAFDSAISMSGSQTVSGTQHLIPSSLYGDAVKLGNYLSNRARGMGADAYAKLMREAVDNQMRYWEGERNKIAEQRLGSFGPAFQRFPDSTALTLESLGHDPSAIRYHPAYKGGGKGAAKGGVSQEDLDARAWLQANPTHPKAAAVAAKLKERGL